MTVEVSTPEGIKAGSSVYQVSAANTGDFLPEAAKRTWSVTGDALTVDLPGGRTLFALLNDLARISMTALDPNFMNDIVESAGRIRRSEGIRSPAQVSEGNYPLLVAFADINDPKTIYKVEPTNLAASFGSDIEIKKIVIAVTDESVNRGIEKKLRWLPGVYATMLDGNELNNSTKLANSLSQGAFVAGRKL